MIEDTFPKLILRNAKTLSDKIAMRHKEFGIWQEWNWRELAQEVQNFSMGMKNIGVKENDNVAIVGSNRPVLYWAFPAVQAIGGVPIPIYSDAVADEMVYVLQHAQIQFAIAQDQEQVDKIISVKDKLPELKAIIYDETRGLNEYDENFLYAFEDVAKMGQENAQQKEKWRENIEKSKGEDLAVILYTSGTTGKPKGVMLSHTNLIVSSQNANEYDNLDCNDEVIAYLPLAWVGDHVFSYGQSLCAGYCVCCPESMETITENRREIAPTYFFAPPRVFETLLSDIMVRMEDAGKFKKFIFFRFMDIAREVGEKILNKESGVPIGKRILYYLGEMLVYGPLKNRLGLTRMRVGYTAGEAIGPEIFQFYRSLGLNLKQLYGQTEASVYITAQPDAEITAQSVGKPCSDVEIDIAENGEVMYRSPGTFIGYYKDDKATKETKNDKGWVKTGDAGFFDQNGHLRIIDRAKDVGKLNNGAMFPPKYIENKLKFFPNIKEAVAVGHEKDFVVVILNIDLPCLASWAERNNIAYGSYQELAGHELVYNMMAEHIDVVNKDLRQEENMKGAQIARFLVLHKELDADDGELTRTMKVRRSLIHERYDTLIDAMYEGADETFIETEVTFEDGRKGKLSATVKIRDAINEMAVAAQ